MAMDWESHLGRWLQNGLIEPEAADRIRAFEAQHQRAAGLRWPTLLAIAMGGLLLAAGVLLFVAAHWDALSPTQRFSLAMLMVGALHIGGALAANRHGALSSALHAVGTISLGAGIFLAGQIFNLQEHWPGGLMLWAIGAGFAWILLRDWPQALLAALLTPAWLGGEWTDAIGNLGSGEKVLAEGFLLLAITYLTAPVPGRDTATRRALMWSGAVFLIPFVFFVELSDQGRVEPERVIPPVARFAGWIVAIGAPLLLAGWLRRKAAWINAVAAAWVIALGATNVHWFGANALAGGQVVLWNELALYALCAAGSIGLIAWGMAEARKERVNLGVAGFALTVLAFYFSTVMDKLGRSASLIGLGVLFLLGGWQLERARRLLVGRLEHRP